MDKGWWASCPIDSFKICDILCPMTDNMLTKIYEILKANGTKNGKILVGKKVYKIQDGVIVYVEETRNVLIDGEIVTITDGKKIR